MSLSTSYEPTLEGYGEHSRTQRRMMETASAEAIVERWERRPSRGSLPHPFVAFFFGVEHEHGTTGVRSAVALDPVRTNIARPIEAIVMAGSRAHCNCHCNHLTFVVSLMDNYKYNRWGVKRNHRRVAQAPHHTTRDTPGHRKN